MVPLWERKMNHEALGTGISSNVFLILNLRHMKVVARKVLKECDAVARKKMLREVKVQREAAKHGLAPQIFTVSRLRCTFDMEPVGPTLKDIWKGQNQKFTESQQRGVIALIDGLVEHGIRHTDLHSKNIMHADDNRFVAIDFGGTDTRANVDFEKGGKKIDEKGKRLMTMLYDEKSGLISTSKEPYTPPKIMNDKIREWGYTVPGTQRAKRPASSRPATNPTPRRRKSS